MQQNNRVNPQLAKQIARQKYTERQIDKWIRWTLDSRGKLIYKELVELHNKLNIKVYG
jgi:hypothetical protein